MKAIAGVLVAAVVFVTAALTITPSGSPAAADSSAPVVAVYGDSLTEQSQDFLGWFYGMRGMTAEFHAFAGTAPCDLFNAMRTLPRPDLAVITFSGNMLTPCTSNRGTPQEVYAQDFDMVASIFGARGVPVVFMAPPGRVGSTEAQNWIATLMQQTAGRHGDTYVYAADVLARDGEYVWWQPCEQLDYDDGNCYLGVVAIRTDDTVHLRRSGQRRWAQRIAFATPLPAAPVVYVYGNHVVDAATGYLSWFYAVNGLRVEFHAWPGTAPCDFFDDMRNAPRPTLVVIAFDADMFTPCTQNRGTAQQVYAQDLETTASIFEQRGIPVRWMSVPGRVDTAEAQNWLATLMQQTAARHGQSYVNAANVLARNGAYVWWQPCQQLDYNDDNCYLGVVLIRADDGIHVRRSGARRWAERVVDASLGRVDDTLSPVTTTTSTTTVPTTTVPTTTVPTTTVPTTTAPPTSTTAGPSPTTTTTAPTPTTLLPPKVGNTVP